MNQGKIIINSHSGICVGILSRRFRHFGFHTVGLCGAILTIIVFPTSAFAEKTQWICEDALFPIVVEARTAADNRVIEFRISGGDFWLPPKSKGSVGVAPDFEIALGQVVQTIELAEYQQQTTVTPVAREAGTLVESIAYYTADDVCGADAVGSVDGLINEGESAKRVCGELSIRVVDEPLGENLQFYPIVSDKWTPVATFTVAIESLSGRWEQTDETPPDGLCE